MPNGGGVSFDRPWWLWLLLLAVLPLLAQPGAGLHNAWPSRVLPLLPDDRSAAPRHEASDPAALQKAMEAVNQLEKLLITHLNIVPRRDLTAIRYSAALGCVLLMLAANLIEIKRWA